MAQQQEDLSTWESIRIQIRDHKYQLHLAQATFKDFAFTETAPALPDLGEKDVRVWFLGSGNPTTLGGGSGGLEKSLSLKRLSLQQQQRKFTRDLHTKLPSKAYITDPPLPSPPSSAVTTLYYVRLPDKFNQELTINSPAYMDKQEICSTTSLLSSSSSTLSEAEPLELDWHRALSHHPTRLSPSMINKDMELLQERKRALIPDGISHYQLLENKVGLVLGDGYFVSEKPGKEPKPPALFPSSKPGGRLNPKIGGAREDILAFVREGDLLVCRMGSAEINLTNDNLGRRTPVTNGYPEFVIQEEFGRYTGFEWWCPPIERRAEYSGERILYTRVDETFVDLVTIPTPTPEKNKAEPETHRYPRPGKPNAAWELRVVDFDLDSSEIRIRHLTAIKSRFPWAEYLVRFGWLPSGLGAWAQILDRRQKHTAVLVIPMSCFVPLGALGGEEEIEVLVEEGSDYWINVTDAYHFVSDQKLIWTSEQSGFRHLYMATSPYHYQTLTSGDWPVADCPLLVDEARGLVYFLGRRETPLELHLYVASYRNPDSRRINQLSKRGASYSFAANPSRTLFVEVRSRLGQLPSCRIVRPHFTDSFLPSTLVPLWDLKLPTHLKTPEQCLPSADFFQFPAEDGTILHGMIIVPNAFFTADPTSKFPVLVQVYGGPRIQSVTNEFKYPRLGRAYLAARMGYIVVLIDNRGSWDRGIRFEGVLSSQLGGVELDDQVSGIQYLSNFHPQYKGRIDLKRVAITGWSYGGYLSVMALIRYPSIFKLAIAGAPVTSWDLYDSAYTERYLGLPSENHIGYQNSSLLSFIDQFPDGANRLLIAHGMKDENVHFYHTEALITKLNQANKPHQVHVYPGERHGLRDPSACDHFDTLMFYWLRNYL